jgi:hypothetical protein
LLMSNRFDVSEVLSAIDNLLEKRELREKDPDLTLKLVDQLKNMEVWFVGKGCTEKSGFLHKIVDFCKKRSFLLDFRGMSDESIGKYCIML